MWLTNSFILYFLTGRSCIYVVFYSCGLLNQTFIRMQSCLFFFFMSWPTHFHPAFLFTGPFKVPMPLKDPTCVYVGRPSDWGNPFTVKQYGRRVAIEKFEVHLLESGLINRIHELCGKRLYCHCFPLNCHASVLIKYAHELKINLKCE